MPERIQMRRTKGPCGCRDLHPMGSGLAPDALDQFAESAPVEVSDEQAELF